MANQPIQRTRDRIQRNGSPLDREPLIGSVRHPLNLPNSMDRTFRVAVLSGLLPLLVGVSLFVLWIISRWDWLMVGGFVTLYGGLVSFLIGVVALTCYCWAACRSADPPRRKWIPSALACAALLLSNFPTAGGIIAAVIAIETSYSVIVHNASQQALSDVWVYGGGCEADLGTIPPGGLARRSLWINRDGKLEFCAVSSSTTRHMIIDGYVTNGIGGRAEVFIEPNGLISVSNELTEPRDAANAR